MTPAGIDIDLQLTRDGFALAARLSLPGEGVTALFGPSGSGKTTILRCIAGLEARASGAITVCGETWLHSEAGVCLPVHARRVGYVFQEGSLLPHLGVRENIEYGWRRVPQRDRRVDYDAVIEWTGVAPLFGRAVDRLSGGERNRVAVARALLTSPAVLLLDEPLAALDAGARAELLPYLERLHRELAIPVLYVSHSLDEVARLADHMAYLDAGKVLAVGPIAQVSSRLDLPLANIDEAGSVIEATVARHDHAFHLTHLAFDGHELVVPQKTARVGTAARIRVLARDVSLSLTRHGDTSILNIIPGTIAEIGGEQPAHVLVKIAVGGAFLLARITRKSASQMNLVPGIPIYAQIKSMALLG